jgi:hypothetical protein
VEDITKVVSKGPVNKNADVFASLKDYRTQNNKPSNNKPSNKTKQQIVQPKFSNKFVRIGKLCELNILQKPPSKKIEAVNSLLFSDKPMSSVTDFFDNDDLDINKEIPEKEVPKVPSDTNPFSIDQPKMTSYQLFKMMKQKEASNL